MTIELTMLVVATSVAIIAVGWIIGSISKKTDVYFRIDRKGDIIINEDCEKLLLKHAEKVDDSGNYRFTVCDGKSILL